MNKKIFLALFLLGAGFMFSKFFKKKIEIRIIEGNLVVPVIDLNNEDGGHNSTYNMIFWITDENGKITYRGRMKKDLLAPLLRENKQPVDPDKLFKIKIKASVRGREIENVHEILSSKAGWIRTPK